MEKLIRKASTTVFKIAFFLCIYGMTLRVIHTYPIPMPVYQQNILIDLSEKFGMHDPELFYDLAFATIDLMVAIFVYVGVVKFWRRLATKP